MFKFLKLNCLELMIVYGQTYHIKKFLGRSDGRVVIHPVPFKVLGVYDYKYNSNKLYIFLSNKFKFDVYLI